VRRLLYITGVASSIDVDVDIDVALAAVHGG
jgi:hypothetical protein